MLTVLAPSSRYHQRQGRRHKKITDWARQMVMQLRRWLPHRPLVLVGDNGYAVLDLLHCCQSRRAPVTLIARLRLDAARYAPAPPRQPGQKGRPARKGPRRPSLKDILEPDQAAWTVAQVSWYQGTTRAGAVPIVELTSQTAVWYRSGKPPVTIRWVLVRDPQGTFGGHLPGSSYPSGFGDPAPVVRPGHRPYYTRPVGSLLLYHPGRPRLAKTSSHHPAHCGLVRQTVAHLRGCRRSGSTTPVAGIRGFFTVRSQHQYAGTPRYPVPPNGGFPHLHRLNCVKPS